MNERYKSKITQDFDQQKYFDNIPNLNNDHQPDNQLIKDQESQQDPLDAFMNQFDQKQPSKAKPLNSKIFSQQNRKRQISPSPSSNMEIQKQNEGQKMPMGFEDQQSFQNSQQNQQSNRDNNQDHFYDQDQVQYIKKGKDKKSEILLPFDFCKIQLEDFQKNFYQEHQDIQRLSPQQVKKIQKQYEIVITGIQQPKPIISFGHLPFHQRIFKTLKKCEYQNPTAIQMQAIPCGLLGRDVVGIAKTGSGKTLAFIWPMIVHVEDQRLSEKNEGPIGLILGPTRQLCQQIYLQVKKFTKKTDIKVACLLGGQNKHDQWKTLKGGVDILIASPGRLIQMIRKKATNLQRVTYLVLDEADRMLSMGFEHQIRSICSQIRQDRQTMLFTATMKKSMQLLVGDIVNQPLRIRVGIQNAANEDVSQSVVVIEQKEQKLQWFKQNINSLLQKGKVLIFANQRQECQQLSHFFQSQMGLQGLVLHGDKNQFERTTIMNQFKSSSQLLVATDIASRGIDVKNIMTVVNYSPPKAIQNYIHRVGRAGRAGATGNAITLLSKNNIKFAIELIQVFQNSGYPVPDQLQEIANLDDKYRRKRLATKMGVSFAKGKDAAKFLNQAIRKQKQGFSRAGIGIKQSKLVGKFQNKRVNLPQKYSTILYDQKPQQTIADSIKGEQNMNIKELASRVRQKYANKVREGNLESQQSGKGHFIKAKQINDSKEKYDKPTITFYSKQKL